MHITNRNYIEKGKSYIAVMNHTSYLDIPAVMTVIPNGAWVGREKLLHLPLFNIMLKRLKYIPIEPSSWRKSLEAIKLAAERSNEGLVILMFPEGTRTDDGGIADFRKGFIRILRESETDVLPITINGLYYWKSKYQKHINTTEQLEIVIGRPLEAEKLLELSDFEIALKVKEAVESEYRYSKRTEG